MSTRVASWDIVFVVLVTLGMATSVEKMVNEVVTLTTYYFIIIIIIMNIL